MGIESATHNVDWNDPNIPDWATHALTTGAEWENHPRHKGEIRFAVDDGQGRLYEGLDYLNSDTGQFFIGDKDWIVLSERPKTTIEQIKGDFSVDVIDVMKTSYSAHYDKYMYRVRITQEDAGKGYKDIKLDPYRVAKVCGIDGGPLEHINKKAMRGTDKGHDMIKVYEEIISAAQRGIEMINEDEK